MAMVSISRELDDARRFAGLSVEQLWYAYVGLGGSSSLATMASGITNSNLITAHEHDVIGHAINEQCMDLGRDRPVAYRRGANALGSSHRRHPHE
jgi:hypothetical protein